MEFTEKGYWERLISRSVARFFLLAALHRSPMHGYELGRAISKTCGGCCSPTDAMIYPALKDLLEGGYVECQEESQGARQRKVCTLTAKGEEAYRAAGQAWGRVLPYLNEAASAALPADASGGQRGCANESPPPRS
jgi:DNA-binding PadR family transcriptional regulator